VRLLRESEAIKSEFLLFCEWALLGKGVSVQAKVRCKKVILCFSCNGSGEKGYWRRRNKGDTAYLRGGGSSGV